VAAVAEVVVVAAASILVAVVEKTYNEAADYHRMVVACHIERAAVDLIVDK
jgi:hypothetical protein